MEKNEELEQTNETENTETQTAEENVEGIELTDTSGAKETEEPEKEEVKKTLKELLKEDPELQEQYNDMLKTRLDREDRKHQKELSKYKNAEEVLKKGLGATDISDAEKKLRDFYKSEGIEMPEPARPGLTDNEVKILAEAEANEIIDSGEAELEANKLASKGYENMNTRERAIFNKLAEHLTNEKKAKELKEIGVDSDLLDSKDFKDFANKFNSKTSIKDIYDLYQQTHKEKKTFKKIGSMKTENKSDGEVKDFYSYDEALKFTKEDFDKNPQLYQAVENSMSKW